MPESSCFRRPFVSQGLDGSRTLLKPALQHFHRNFPLIYKKLSLKKSVLVRSKVLGLFGNILTANHMYSRHIWENSPNSHKRYYLKNQKQIRYHETVW